MKRITLNFNDGDKELLNAIDIYCRDHSITYTTFFKTLATAYLPPSKGDIDKFFTESLKSTNENASLFYEMMTSNKWKDKNGNLVRNWKSFAFCFDRKLKIWKTTENAEDYLKNVNEDGEVVFK